MTNVARHAKAKQVRIILSLEDHKVSVRVEDDGVGMPEGSLEDYHSIGLFGMQERARLIGGHLRIVSEQGEGTCVLVSVPVAIPTS